MAFLKRFLNKVEVESLFPQKVKVTAEPASSGESVASSDIVGNLIDNQKFIRQVSKSVAQIVLDNLCKQYDFTPTDKYLEEVSNRKRYISQLDSYLQERKQINSTVESELQAFLHETSSNLTKALDTFTVSIQSRIKQAESRHSIDSIKKSLLCVESAESPLLSCSDGGVANQT